MNNDERFEELGIQVIPADLLAKATTEEQETYLTYLIQQVKEIDDWQAWIKLFFSHVANKPFSDGHIRFYEWIWSIERDIRPLPFVAIWPRSYGKSSSLEMAIAALAARGKRKYGLIVSETIDQAQDHVANVAELLSSPLIELAYPGLGTPMVTKTGSSRGWRRDRLTTSTGFVLDALGLDTSSRGIKFDENRPDFISWDDIDSELDTEETTLKKIKIITHKLIPAGSKDCAALMVQNIVHKNSIFARLCSKGEEGEPPPAEFLRNRTVHGPIPAVLGLEVEDINGQFTITAGESTWPQGFPISTCQEIINDVGLTAFLSEYQHETEPPLGGIFDHIKFRHIGLEDCPKFKRVVVTVDPAVTSAETSDCSGIQCDALGIDNKIYRLFSWGNA